VRLIEPSSSPGSLGWTRETATLALLSFAMLIVSLDQYIVVVALPDIARNLDIPRRRSSRSSVPMQ
jgi:hypothetical protein